jgi:putative endonuclease
MSDLKILFMKTMYVYILKCNDQSYYTGVTNDLEKRLHEHEAGINKECYTYTRRPLELKFYEIFDNADKAISSKKRSNAGQNQKKKR